MHKKNDSRELEIVNFPIFQWWRKACRDNMKGPNKTMNKFYCGEKKKEENGSYKSQNCLKMHKLHFPHAKTENPKNRYKLGYFFILSQHMSHKLLWNMKVNLLALAVARKFWLWPELFVKNLHSWFVKLALRPLRFYLWKLF